MPAVKTRTSEIKTRTTPEVKKNASKIYSKWGLSLSDAINIFLVKSVEVGGLPFNMRSDNLYEKLEPLAYKAKPDQNGVLVLPSEWDDDE